MKLSRTTHAQVKALADHWGTTQQQVVSMAVEHVFIDTEEDHPSIRTVANIYRRQNDELAGVDGITRPREPRYTLEPRS